MAGKVAYAHRSRKEDALAASERGRGGSIRSPGGIERARYIAPLQPGSASFLVTGSIAISD